MLAVTFRDISPTSACWKKLSRRRMGASPAGYTIAFFIALFTGPVFAQQPLDLQIRQIVADARGKVSVACSLPGTSLNCDLNPTAHPPMQSVFKLPLAVTVLHQVEAGKFALKQPIRFLPEDLILPKPYSPLQDKYPHAGVELPLDMLLEMTVSLSDNTAADILLRLAGGPNLRAPTEYGLSLPVRVCRNRPVPLGEPELAPPSRASDSARIYLRVRCFASNRQTDWYADSGRMTGKSEVIWESNTSLV